MLPFEVLSTAEIARELAGRLRRLRLSLGWTQVETASRAAMTLASYKRFERTGDIALSSLLRIAMVTGQIAKLEPLFQAPAFRTLEEAIAPASTRQRAPRRRKIP